MHHRLLWKGWPCFTDGLLAQMLQGAKNYMRGLDEATGVIDQERDQTNHYMIIMLLFASARTDLTANLLADERDLSEEEKEDFKLQWQRLGFPIGVREELRTHLTGD